MKSNLPCSLMILCALALLSASSGLGQEKGALQLPRHLPGSGVADPAGKTGFFPNTAGDIDALDLATGKVRWTSKDANRPLLATDNRLFAQQSEKGKD